jgi:hypothetical protein
MWDPCCKPAPRVLDYVSFQSTPYLFVLYYLRFPRDLQLRVVHICFVQYGYGSPKEARKNFERPIETDT